MKLQKYGTLLIFLAAMLWATDAPFRVHLTQTLPSSFIVLVEHFIDVLFILPFIGLVWHDAKKLDAKGWTAVLVIAVGGSALASFAFTKAFSYVNPSVAILLQKLQPLIAISLAAGLLRERLNKHFWLWAVVALFGAYLISFAGLVPRLFVGERFNPNVVGVLLALAAAVLWGASTVMGKMALNEIGFKAMTGLRFIFGFIFLLLWNSLSGSIRAVSSVTPLDWLFFVIIAVTSGVVSLFIYYRGLQYTKASVATLAELGFPLAAVVVNYFFLHDKINWYQLSGIAVLFFSVIQLNRVNSREVLAIKN
jgi:drug/metabolite transporter (DMT)-like permease